MSSLKRKLSEINPQDRIDHKKSKKTIFYDLETQFTFLLQSTKKPSDRKNPIDIETHMLEIKPSFQLQDVHLELQRVKFFNNLRNEHKKLIQNSLYKLKPPKESFNRFIMERRLYCSVDDDPLFPSIENLPYSTLLYREISEDLPIKINMFPKTINDAKRSLSSLIKKSKFFVEKTDEKYDKNEVKVIYDILKKSESFQNNSETSIEKWIDEMKGTQKKLCEIFTKKLHDKIEGICVNLDRLCVKYSKEMKNEIAEKIYNDEKYLNCKFRNDDYGIAIKGEDHIFYPNDKCLIKLRKLYRGDQNDFEFHRFMLFCRYENFFGIKGPNVRPYEGAGHQGAVPSDVMKVLNEKMGVEMECFASPFNCHFKYFCSAFLDTDYWFGGIGSFFDFYPVSGSFEANPPFVEELLIKMVMHIERLCENADKSDNPISFTIILPHWDDAESIIMLKKSKYLTRNVILNERNHSFINGFQHKIIVEKREFYKAVHDSVVFFMQSKRGNEKWKPTDEICEDLKKLFV